MLARLVPWLLILPMIHNLQLRRLLPSCCHSVQECPETVDGKAVILEGGDVFFTGKEIFVGIRKHGTNFEGAKVSHRVLFSKI